MRDDDVFTTVEAARALTALGLVRAPGTLVNERGRGGGPEFIQDDVSGRIIYTGRALKRHVSDRLKRRRSTADPGVPVDLQTSGDDQAAA